MLEIIICISILIIAVVIFVFYQTKKLIITNYTIINGKIKKSISSIDGIKIVFFTDLHIGRYMHLNKLEEIVDKLYELDADIYIFGGDLIGKKTNKYFNDYQIKKCFEKLSDKCLISVYGNHEYKIEKGITLDEKMKLFKSMGFTILCNEEFVFNKKDKQIVIYGMNECMHNTPVLPNKKYDLIISHQGDIIEKCDDQIMLSGHTHGGQIRIPYIPLYYKPKMGKKYRYGLYNVNNNQLLVSSGLGYGKLKIRLFALREIVVINYINN